MPVYADTSLLASYYLLDANTARAVAALQAAGTPAVYTALHRLELRSAIAQAVFRGAITSSQAQAVWLTVTNDIAAGLLTPRKVNWYAVFRRASFYSHQYSPATGCRSLDTLHVAAAHLSRLPELLSFDARQRALAQRVGRISRKTVISWRTYSRMR